MARYWLMLLPAAGLATAALAADPPPVKRADVERRTAQMFDRADADHDGVLTREEFVAAAIAIARARGGTPTPKGIALVEAQFDAVDASHTGRISRADFLAEKMVQFDAMDLDHDGVVSARESYKAANRLRAKLKAEARAQKEAASGAR